MTHHDLLIDSITEYLYHAYDQGKNDNLWDDAIAEQKAQEILVIVEEFQEARAKLGKSVTYKNWRASD